MTIIIDLMIVLCQSIDFDAQVLALDDVPAALEFADAPIGELDSLELIAADAPVVVASADDDNDGEDLDDAAPSAYLEQAQEHKDDDFANGTVILSGDLLTESNDDDDGPFAVDDQDRLRRPVFVIEKRQDDNERLVMSSDEADSLLSGRYDACADFLFSSALIYSLRLRCRFISVLLAKCSESGPDESSRSSIHKAASYPAFLIIFRQARKSLGCF